MYRTIDAAFWTDPKVRRLSSDARLLFLYLITNPHTHVSGIYYLSRGTIAHETGLTAKAVNTLSDTLSSAGFCGFDAESEVVWVKKMMKYQGRGEKNVRSAAHHIVEDLHHSTLIADFLDAYPEVKAIVGDRVSIGYSEKSGGATPDSRSLNPDSRILIPEQEQDSAALFGEFQNVKLTDDEQEKLIAKFGHDSGLQRIEALSAYMQSTGKKYKDHYATILNWNNRNGGNGNGRQKSKADLTREACERVLTLSDSKARSGGECGD